MEGAFVIGLSQISSLSFEMCIGCLVVILGLNMLSFVKVFSPLTSKLDQSGRVTAQRPRMGILFRC